MDKKLVYKKIKSIKKIKKIQRVYNFNVPGYESYVANGFVVHNCENHKISQVVPDVNKVKNFSPSDVVNIVKSHKCSSICFSFNEPTLNPEYIGDIYDLIEKDDISIVLKTNAFINKEPWSYILNKIDAVNIDWKGSVNSFKEIAGVKDYVLSDRIREAILLAHVEISVPLYYQDFDSMRESMFDLGKIISEYPEVPCHLLRIYPNFEMEESQITSEEMIQEAYSILRKCGAKNLHIFKS